MNLSVATNFDKRSDLRELLDAPDIAENDIVGTFSFIRFINRYGGGHRAVRKGLKIALDSWSKQKPVEILDVGCGTGDMAHAIVNYGKKHGFIIRYTGIDRNKKTIRLAKIGSPLDSTKYMVGDLFDPNIPEADIVIASMVFHHFSDEDIKNAFLHLINKSRYALIINDLLRSVPAYVMCYLLTRFIKSDACRNDAPLSVRKGFRVEEMECILNELGVRGTVKKCFGGRFVAVIQK